MWAWAEGRLYAGCLGTRVPLAGKDVRGTGEAKPGRAFGGSLGDQVGTTGLGESGSRTPGAAAAAAPHASLPPASGPGADQA